MFSFSECANYFVLKSSKILKKLFQTSQNTNFEICNIYYVGTRQTFLNCSQMFWLLSSQWEHFYLYSPLIIEMLSFLGHTQHQTIQKPDLQTYPQSVHLKKQVFFTEL